MFTFFEFFILPFILLVLFVLISQNSNYLFMGVILSLYSFSQNVVNWPSLNLFSSKMSYPSAIIYLAKTHRSNIINNMLSILCVSIFILVLVSNLIGLFPFQESITSGLAYTLCLSFSVWFICTIIGIYYYNIHLLGIFIPASSPWLMSPLFLLLELVSYSFRAISLGVRLWANMTAGHSLLHILTGMVLGLVNSLNTIICLPITFLTSTLLSSLVGLEWLICLLQSGVFIMLTSFYVAEVWFVNNKIWSSIRI